MYLFIHKERNKPKILRLYYGICASFLLLFHKYYTLRHRTPWTNYLSAGVRSMDQVFPATLRAWRAAFLPQALGDHLSPCFFQLPECVDIFSFPAPSIFKADGSQSSHSHAASSWYGPSSPLLACVRPLRLHWHNGIRMTSLVSRSGDSFHLKH